MFMPRTKGPAGMKRICISCKRTFVVSKARPYLKTCGEEECIKKALSENGKLANKQLRENQGGSINPHLVQHHITLPKITKSRQELLDKEKEADEMRIKYYKMMGRLR